MRKVRSFESEKERQFIPESFDNHLDKDPVTVWIKQPTERQKREILAYGRNYELKLNAKGEPVKDDQGNYTTEVDQMTELNRQVKTVKQFVTKVENYTGSNDTPITTGEELAEHGEAEIVIEVSNDILLSLSLGDKDLKKSVGSLDSSRAVTPRSVGRAKNAKRKRDQKKETALVTSTSSLPISYEGEA